MQLDNNRQWSYEHDFEYDFAIDMSTVSKDVVTTSGRSSERQVLYTEGGPVVALVTLVAAAAAPSATAGDWTALRLFREAGTNRLFSQVETTNERPSTEWLRSPSPALVEHVRSDDEFDGSLDRFFWALGGLERVGLAVEVAVEYMVSAFLDIAAQHPWQDR